MKSIFEILNEKRNSDYNKLLKDVNSKDLKGVREVLDSIYQDLVDGGYENDSIESFLSELVSTELEQINSKYT